MKVDEIQAIISSLMDCLHYGELAMRGEHGGITLTKEQIDELKTKCVAAKNKAIDYHKNLVADVFDIEFNHSKEPEISKEDNPSNGEIINERNDIGTGVE